MSEQKHYQHGKYNKNSFIYQLEDTNSNDYIKSKQSNDYNQKLIMRINEK